MVTYVCGDCGARWTDTDANNVCPACTHGVGQVEVKRKAMRHDEAAESQELHAIPSEQAYMRYIARKYGEALSAFLKTLDPSQSWVTKLVTQHLERVSKFERDLEGMGLPLELPLNRTDGDKAKAVNMNLREAESALQSARDLFLELFNTPEAVAEIERRFRG